MKKQFLKLAILSWFIGTGTLFAQSAGSGRGDYFVAIPDKTSPVIIATDANQICSAIPFIDAVSGKVMRGTSQDGNCLGKQTAVLRTCTRDGNASCVVVPVVPGGTELKAVDASSDSDLKPENIRRGITLGGVAGKWPSAEVTLPPGTSSPLSTLDGYAAIVSVPTKKEYTLFGADGTPYKFTISAIGASDFPPTTILTDFSSAKTLYKGFGIAGDGNLVSGNIKAGSIIFGTQGNAVPRSSWIKFSSGDFFSVTDRNGTATIAKAKVFFDPATENKWMLLRNNDADALAKTAPSSAAAQTMCSNAKTTQANGSDMGTWALANEKDLFWARVTGGTGSNGLFAAEGLFGAGELAKNFWISTATAGENKVAHFPDSLLPPDTDDLIPTSAMVVCVQKVNSAQAPPPS